MEVKWIVEDSDLEKENWNKITEYLKSKNRKVFRPKYVPFSSQKLETDFSDKDCVVAFGCLGLIRSINRFNSWIPGVWCNWDILKCSNYLIYYGDHSIHYDFAFYPLGYLKNNKDKIYQKFNTDSLFIRPDDNFKSFNGEIVSIEHWDRFWSYNDCYSPDRNSFALVSKPSKILNEWRYIIADGKVVTGSQYRDHTGPSISTSIDGKSVYFAEELCKIWTPHPIFVMDICQLENNSYKLIEIGSVNGAGLYDCDTNKIVDIVEKIAEREWLENEN